MPTTARLDLGQSAANTARDHKDCLHRGSRSGSWDPLKGTTPMFDYLRIMLNGRLAKMDERGASAVEYGLLIAGIAALIVVVVFAFGGSLKGIFTDTCSKVTASATSKKCS